MYVWLYVHVGATRHPDRNCLCAYVGAALPHLTYNFISITVWTTYPLRAYNTNFSLVFIWSGTATPEKE